jgi:hypothetical protein
MAVLINKVYYLIYVGRYIVWPDWRYLAPNIPTFRHDRQDTLDMIDKILIDKVHA